MLDQLLNIIKKLIPKKLFKLLQPFYHWLLAKISAFIYGYPSNKMIIIGITGTAGKSSTCYFIAQILEQAGFKVGMTTTTLFKIGNYEWLNDKKMTMLGRFQTQKLLKQMVKKNCEIAIIETSSQGIEQYRHIGINYDILVFTNLYPEHIEAHGGFENYKKAKGKLFKYLSHSKHKDVKKLRQVQKIKKLGKFIKKTIIVNLDDEYAGYFLNFKADKKIGFGVNYELETKNYGNGFETIKAGDVKNENGKIKFIIHNLSAAALADAGSLFTTPLLGNYNIYNVLAGISVAKILGVNWEKIKTAVANLKPLPGRLEFIQDAQDNLGVNIIVDYAFEPRALEKLYETVKSIDHNKIIHILGSAGGGRDKARRPILGQIAAKNADIVIVTNEDPYDEEPMKIIDEVAAGAEEIKNQRPKTANQKSETQILKILDRREAIRKALKLAKKNDLILITGKGAEQAICVKNGKKIPWDDRKVVKEELSHLSSK